MTSFWLSQIVGRGWQQQVFTTSGVWTHPKPGTCVRGTAVCVGGGGQGGGGQAGATNSTQTNRQGGGGSPGAVTTSEFVATADVVVTVGVGGTGAGAGMIRDADGAFFQASGNAANEGADGTASSFGQFCLALGGAGATYGGGNFVVLPIPQQSLSAIGALELKGGPGRISPPAAGDSIMGFAGGAIGTTASMGGATSTGGSGGSAGFSGAGGSGGDGVVNTSDIATTGSNGADAPTNSGAGGGGGSGATKSASTNLTGVTTGGTGGNGGSGRVIVYWELPA